MWTIIIFTILGLILGVIIDDGNGLWGGCLVFGFFIGLIIALILPAKLEKKEIITVYNLECLQDNSCLTGNFFIGNGNIDGNMIYVFYYKVNTDGKDGFKQMRLDCDEDITIYYNDSAYIEKILTTDVKVKDAFINHFAIDMFFSDTKYIFNIPKGSIKQDYTLDAK